MQVLHFTLGPLQTNGYLVAQDGQAAFIDPGGDPAAVLSALKREGLDLKHIINTHLHCDHIYGNATLAEETGAPILAPSEDSFLLDTEVGGGGLMGLPKVEPFQFAPLEEGAVSLAGMPATVLHTPGHTPGSMSLYFPEAGKVFVGDLLFRRSIGRTDFPGGSTETLLASVREKIFTLPPETVVYSGHGPETTVGDESRHNSFFMG